MAGASAGDRPPPRPQAPSRPTLERSASGALPHLCGRPSCPPRRCPKLCHGKLVCVASRAVTGPWTSESVRRTAACVFCSEPCRVGRSAGFRRGQSPLALHVPTHPLPSGRAPPTVRGPALSSAHRLRSHRSPFPPCSGTRVGCTRACTQLLHVLLAAPTPITSHRPRPALRANAEKRAPLPNSLVMPARSCSAQASKVAGCLAPCESSRLAMRPTVDCM